jgi:hypothetical protein
MKKAALAGTAHAIHPAARTAKRTGYNEVNCSIERVLSQLKKVRQMGDTKWTSCCPAHEDRDPSLSITLNEAGDKILLHCHAGCSNDAVRSALGLEWSDLFSDTASETAIPPVPIQKPTKTWSRKRGYQTLEEALHSSSQKAQATPKTWMYPDGDDQLVGAVVRWDTPDGKRVRPFAFRDGRWYAEAFPSPRPLLNLADSANADLVLIVEGETCVDTVACMGLVAVTSAGGASAAHQSDWRPLAGKHVVILPDADEAGEKYATSVAEILVGLDPTTQVRTLRLPNLEEGGDVADWAKRQKTGDTPLELRNELLNLIDNHAEPWPSIHAPVVQNRNEWKEAVARAAGIRPMSYDEQFPDVEEPAEDKAEFEGHEPDADSLWIPFPTQLLPEVLRRFVAEAAREIRCDESLVALPAMGILAGLIGNSAVLSLSRNWKARAILWTMTIADSGCKKSPAFKAAANRLEKVNNELWPEIREKAVKFEEDKKRYDLEFRAHLMDPITTPRPVPPPEPVIERFFIVNTTIEKLVDILYRCPRGTLVMRDELSGWLADFDRYARGSSDVTAWLETHNAGAFVVDRKADGILPKTAAHAAVSIAGTIQPLTLARVFSDAHRDAGLLARFIFAKPPKVLYEGNAGDMTSATEDAMERLMKALCKRDAGCVCAGDTPNADTIELSVPARAAWEVFQRQHELRLIEVHDHLASAVAKLGELPARLALVFHIVQTHARSDAETQNFDAGEVSGETMRAAIVMTEWFLHETSRVYGWLDAGKSGRNKFKLHEWIVGKGGRVRPRDVQAGCRWLRAKGAARTALQELVESGMGSWEPIDASGQANEVFIAKQNPKTEGQVEQSLLDQGKIRVMPPSVTDAKNLLDVFDWRCR